MTRSTRRVFRPLGAIAYDDRILTFKQEDSTVSIMTVEGRERVPYVLGPGQREMMPFRKGESDLCLVKGKWFLNVTCDITPEDRREPEDMIGVDVGIRRLATTSTGVSYTGDAIERKRQWYLRRRSELQQVGTKSAKRRLRQLSGKERRFRKDTNHVISKQIVAVAKGTRSGIAMENLKGIGKRVTVRKKQRAMFSGWSFYQLQQFIRYKAESQGVVVVCIDPHYTSQCCSKCFHIERGNRRSQSEFCCRRCGHAEHADPGAAKVISILGLRQWSYGGEVAPMRLQLQATAFEAVVS